MRNPLCLVLVAVTLVACASSPGVTAAQRGDRAALSAYIKPLYDKGRIDNDEAAKIAKAELQQALTSSKDKDALERLRDALPCEPEVRDVFTELASTHDALGAAATLALHEAGDLSDSRAREWAHDPMPEWRAVGVSAMVRTEDSETRRLALVDPSPEVRRAAMRACGRANDPRDLDGLFEAARLDPDPMARNQAVRAISRIETNDPEVANRLRDLWNGADDAVREDIASAYASPSIVAHGGAEALRVLVAAGHGPGVISGAAAITWAPAHYDQETRASALALLLRTIDSGSRRDRSFALAVVPTSDPQVVLAITKASEDAADSDIRVSALSRLLEVPSTRGAAVTKLIELAQPDDSHAAIGARARGALARAGELRVQAWIEKDLSSEDASVRLDALSSLAALKRPARGVRLLADADARVRARAACAIIVASR